MNIRRHRLQSAVAVGALSLILSACGAGSDGASPNAGQGAATVEATSAPLDEVDVEVRRDPG